MIQCDHSFVSVVIPCLNRAHFLTPTIESVLQQDYPHIECIVVDGGSTDGTIDILKRYGDRIKWVSEPDDGHTDAINKGWRMSTGGILAWLNADDVWAVPDAVSKAVEYLQAHPDVDVVYGDCGAIDAEGNLVGMSYLHEWDLGYAVEFCDHCIPQPAAFIRREILEKVGWLDVSFVSKKDHELWPRIGLAGNIRHIPVVLAHARACPGYMAQQGDVTAAACVALTRKFFTLPHVPDDLKKKKKRALTNAYLRGMDYAWQDGRHWEVVLTYALRAALMDVTKAVNVFNQIRTYVGTAAMQNTGLRWAARGLALPGSVRRSLQRIIRQIRGARRPSIPNLLGDRDIEWSWIASQMPSGPGEALDFGNGGSHLGLIAAQRDFHVTAVDLGLVQWPYMHHNLRFIKGDILKLPLSRDHFDLIINCSTVEHVGLAGRYGVTEDRPDGDFEVMARLRELMKPDGVMLLTIPVGQDAVFMPLCRVYGRQRLPHLLEGFGVEKEAFWAKNTQNQWVNCGRDEALNFKASAGSWDPLRNVYAIGCFVVRRG
jgi:glycosyltransferase involved in cell wall biosynthesis/2-polyprenyl-3-methyl-5-hydroxy-6-metoxy-1,4-benzoquinol methylase